MATARQLKAKPDGTPQHASLRVVKRHAIADRVWLSLAVHQLPRSQGVVLTLFLRGFGSGAISRSLGLKFHETRRLFWRALDRLLADLIVEAP